MREHRKTILLTQEEFELWSEKACAEGVTFSAFIRRRVREALSMQIEMNALYLQAAKIKSETAD